MALLRKRVRWQRIVVNKQIKSFLFLNDNGDVQTQFILSKLKKLSL
jgi:hypothetical protein